jgi:hypothetical protein
MCSHIGQGPFLACAYVYGLSLPASLQQWLKHREYLLDNQAITLSSRMNAVGLIERG